MALRGPKHLLQKSIKNTLFNKNLKYDGCYPIFERYFRDITKQKQPRLTDAAALKSLNEQATQSFSQKKWIIRDKDVKEFHIKESLETDIILKRYFDKTFKESQYLNLFTLADKLKIPPTAQNWRTEYLRCMSIDNDEKMMKDVTHIESVGRCSLGNVMNPYVNKSKAEKIKFAKKQSNISIPAEKSSKKVQNIFRVPTPKLMANVKNNKIKTSKPKNRNKYSTTALMARGKSHKHKKPKSLKYSNGLHNKISVSDNNKLSLIENITPPKFIMLDPLTKHYERNMRKFYHKEDSAGRRGALRMKSKISILSKVNGSYIPLDAGEPVGPAIYASSFSVTSELERRSNLPDEKRLSKKLHSATEVNKEIDVNIANLPSDSGHGKNSHFNLFSSKGTRFPQRKRISPHPLTDGMHAPTNRKNKHLAEKCSSVDSKDNILCEAPRFIVSNGSEEHSECSLSNETEKISMDGSIKKTIKKSSILSKGMTPKISEGITDMWEAPYYNSGKTAKSNSPEVIPPAISKIKKKHNIRFIKKRKQPSLKQDSPKDLLLCKKYACCCYLCSLIRRRQSDPAPLYLEELPRQRERIVLKNYYLNMLHRNQTEKRDKRDVPMPTTSGEACNMLHRCLRVLQHCRNRVDQKELLNKID